MRWSRAPLLIDGKSRPWVKVLYNTFSLTDRKGEKSNGKEWNLDTGKTASGK